MTARPGFSTVAATKGTVESSVDLNGKVVPENTAHLGFEIGGRVAATGHAVGDVVSAGSVIASLDATELSAGYRAAQDMARSAHANADQSQALLNRSRQQLYSLKHGHAIAEDKRAQQEQIIADEATVKSGQAAAAAADEGVVAARARLSQSSMIAPFDGVIAEQTMKVGEVAQAGTPVVTLISQDAFKVETYASEIDVKALAIGDVASVTLSDAVSGQAHIARVVAIDPAETDQGGVSRYKVTLGFTDPVEGLRSGVDAHASIVTAVRQSVITIPREAILQYNGKQFVTISSDGARETRDVEVGLSGHDGQVEIVSGLNAGDRVFTVVGSK